MLTVPGQTAVATAIPSRLDQLETEASGVRRRQAWSYPEIFNAVNEAIFIHDADTGAIVDVNDSMLHMFGFSREESLRLTVNQSSLGTSPYSATEAQQWIAKAVAEGPQVFEWQARRKSGELFWVEVSLKVAEIGKQRRVLALVRDISERIRVKELLHKQQQEIRTIVENSPDLIVRFDRNLRQTYVNPALLRVMGLPKEACLGQEAGSAIIEGNVRRIVEEVWLLRGDLERVRDSGRPLDFEATSATLGGRRNLAIRLEPEFDLHGALTSILLIARDITELKESQAKLLQAQAESARVARVTTLGELTASIAHELNQPLGGVVTNANAAVRWLDAHPPNLEEVRWAVHRIASDGNRANEVIRRIRALISKSAPTKTAFSLNELIQETIALTQPELNRKQVALRTELAPALPCVTADRVQVQQVILNLMVNALDSLSAVADRLRVLRIRTEHSQPDAVQMAVEDTGGGVAPEEIEKVFAPFYTTKPQGLGMGLAISRSIVEAHGGRLWATPHDGCGATFQFTLPVQEGGGS
jgi:PAS domain S-box-containing protein